MLNQKQTEVVNLALSGHNLFINGYAGSGKTYTINEIYHSLTSVRKNVVITCSTGIACANYKNAYTLHRWSGINDGRYSSTEIVQKISSNQTVCERIRNTDVLIIDEISMISLKLFEQVIHIVSQLKDNSKFCGGMQLIVAGDFFQLPPVPNKHYNDPGEFCFKSSIFQQLHRFTLTEIVRQRDMNLIQAIREISKGGEISDDIVNYVKTLERPLTGSEDSTKLFAKNDLVNSYNRSRIEHHPGDLHEFCASDSGHRKYLDELTVLSKLWLKIDCPVVLIRNLTNKLVNGLQGRVTEFSVDGPTVYFPSTETTTTIKKASFTVFSPKNNTVLAERVQIPLLLSYALTVHKCQGMTLNRVEVDCQQMFKAGQLGVAMGRVCSADGLRIINFHPRFCFPQPIEVQQYLEEPVNIPVDDLSCCTRNCRQEDVILKCWFGEELEEDVPAEESDLEDDFNELISAIDMDDRIENITLPENFDVLHVLKDQIINEPVTQIQEDINKIIDDITNKYMNYCEEFCHVQINELSSILQKLEIIPGSEVKPDKLTEFYEAVRKHQISDNYRVACLLLFQAYPKFTNAHASICTDLFNTMKKFLLHEKVNVYVESQRKVHERKITVSSKPRIRYVAGYCIATLRQKYTRNYRANIYSTTSIGQSHYNDAKCKLSLIESMTVNESDLKTSTDTDTDSLADIERRQYGNRGLTNVSNEIYELFVKICNNCLELLTDKNLNTYGKNLHEYCADKLFHSPELFEEFGSILNKHEIPVDFQTYASFSDTVIVTNILANITLRIENQIQLFKKLLKIFLNVMFNQFRKDLLLSFSIQKTMAHRKQILVKQKKKDMSSTTVTFQTIVDDKSDQKEMSHSLLRGLLLSDIDVLNAMKRTHLDTLAKAYNIKGKQNVKKSVLADIVKQAIVKMNRMPNVSVFRGNEGDTQQESILRSPEPAAASIEEAQPSSSATSDEQPSTSSVLVVQPSTSSVLVEQPSTSSVAVVEQTSTSATLLEQSQTALIDAMESDERELCGICHKVGKEGAEWIQCSSCNIWLHRYCAGLRAKKTWLKYQKEGTDFFCKQCQ